MKAPPTLPRAAGPRGGSRLAGGPGRCLGMRVTEAGGEGGGPWKLVGRICLLAGRRDFGPDTLLLCYSSEMISLERNLTLFPHPHAIFRCSDGGNMSIIKSQEVFEFFFRENVT